MNYDPAFKDRGPEGLKTWEEGGRHAYMRQCYVLKTVFQNLLIVSYIKLELLAIYSLELSNRQTSVSYLEYSYSYYLVAIVE